MPTQICINANRLHVIRSAVELKMFVCNILFHIFVYSNFVGQTYREKENRISIFRSNELNKHK